MAIWHHENEPIIGKTNKEEPTYARPNSHDLPGNETLNLNSDSEVPTCHNIGGDKCIKYVQHNYIDDPYKVQRSEKDGVSLTKILATSLDRKFELKKSIDRVISVSKKGLDKAMSKDEVGEELSLVVDQLNSTAGILPIFIKLNPI